MQKTVAHTLTDIFLYHDSLRVEYLLQGIIAAILSYCYSWQGLLHCEISWWLWYRPAPPDQDLQSYISFPASISKPYGTFRVSSGPTPRPTLSSPSSLYEQHYHHHHHWTSRVSSAPTPRRRVHQRWTIDRVRKLVLSWTTISLIFYGTVLAHSSDDMSSSSSSSSDGNLVDFLWDSELRSSATIWFLIAPTTSNHSVIK